MLMGQDHSGKASLKNSLMGKRFNRLMDSTVGIDVDPWHFKVSTELWKAGVKSEVTDSVTALPCRTPCCRDVATRQQCPCGKC